MVAMSRTFGTRRSTTGSSASSVAASAGKAAFLAPLAATVPTRRLGPWMRKRAIVARSRRGVPRRHSRVASLADGLGVYKASARGEAAANGCGAGSVPRELPGGPRRDGLALARWWQTGGPRHAAGDSSVGRSDHFRGGG